MNIATVIYEALRKRLGVPADTGNTAHGLSNSILTQYGNQTKWKPIPDYTVQPTLNSTTYTNIVSVTGSGIMTSLAFEHRWSGDYTILVNTIPDGGATLFHEFRMVTTANGPVGYVYSFPSLEARRHNLFNSSTSAGSYGKALPLAAPIYFNSSLVVQARLWSGSDNNPFRVHVGAYLRE